MIVVDTGPLVGLFDKDDCYHKLCKETLKRVREPLVTNWAVLTEVMYLLDFSLIAQNLCFDFIESGGIDIRSGNASQIYRIHQLLKQYNDLPIDFADASIVALSEEENIKTVFTLDHKDFRIYSPKHTKAFHLIPDKIPKR